MSGTKFNSSKQEEEVWFTYCDSTVDQDGKTVWSKPAEGAGRVRLRSPAPFITERFSKKKRNHEFVFNPKTRGMERVTWFDEITPEQAKTDGEDTWDFCITGLENFFIGGDEVPCTQEGKNRLMAIPAFDRFIGLCLKQLGEAQVEAKEEEAKNS